MTSKKEENKIIVTEEQKKNIAEVFNRNIGNKLTFEMVNGMNNSIIYILTEGK